MLRILAVSIVTLVSGLTFLMTSVVSGAMAPGYSRSSVASTGGTLYVATAPVPARPRSPPRQRYGADRSASVPLGLIAPTRGRVQAIYVPPF